MNRQLPAIMETILGGKSLGEESLGSVHAKLNIHKSFGRNPSQKPYWILWIARGFHLLISGNYNVFHSEQY